MYGADRPPRSERIPRFGAELPPADTRSVASSLKSPDSRPMVPRPVDYPRQQSQETLYRRVVSEISSPSERDASVMVQSKPEDPYQAALKREEKLQAEISTLVQGFRTELDEAHQRNEQLIQQLEASKGTVARLQHELERANQQAQHERQQRKQLEARLQERQEGTDTQLHIQELRDTLLRQEGEIAALRHVNDRLTQQLTAARSYNDSYQLSPQSGRWPSENGGYGPGYFTSPVRSGFTEYYTRHYGP
eukprot:TRINITY_DN67526_c0_g1_i1.p1 TRINITY_DN67526_c0_g1~~TRINITY_DN67526_c0_g1_i1.p1  ORF type:complete len:261 (-),score=37.83 TRINITY_DN67526_c0_g1_i1:41-787(-)